MFKQGDWVKLAADEPSMNLKAGMLGQVSLVVTDPPTGDRPARTVYVVQLLTDGLGLLMPPAAEAPIVGDETDFVAASKGDVLFATGAETLKNKILTPMDPSGDASQSFDSQPPPPPFSPAASTHPTPVGNIKSKSTRSGTGTGGLVGTIVGACCGVAGIVLMGTDSVGEALYFGIAAAIGGGLIGGFLGLIIGAIVEHEL
jgi:hypothetical protein